MRVVDLEQLKPCLAKGFDLIPICKWDSKRAKKPSGKMPRDKNWVVQKYPGSAIKEWLSQGGNIGVRIREDEVVVDVDPKNQRCSGCETKEEFELKKERWLCKGCGAEGQSADGILDSLEIELGLDIQRYPTVRTGSGGLHIYMKKPEAGRVRNTIDLFGGAIEFKSLGRQVLAPGCKHPNGRFYIWERNSDRPVAECPVELWEQIKKPEQEKRERTESEVLAAAQIKACLEQLDPTNFREYDDWRNLMFSVHYAGAGDQDVRDIFVRWCVSDPQYRADAEVIEAMWEHASDNRGDYRTEKTLFWHVFQAGGKVPLDLDILDDVEVPESYDELEEDEPMPLFERDNKGKIKHTISDNVIKSFKYLGIAVRHDVFADRKYLIDSKGVFEVQFGLPDGTEIQDEVREQMALAVTREIRFWTGDPSDATMKRAFADVIVPEHPLQRWLESLTWDGVPRLDTWLINTSDLADTPYNRAVSRLMLYSAVGRVLSPGIKYDTMIILEGPQGGYKSTLIRWLGGQWSSEGLPHITAGTYKDVVAAMKGKWLIEIEELSAMRKSDVDFLKGFLSRTEDRVREAYRKDPKNYKRQCVFIGTTNDDDYLRDVTGNRRYLPLCVGVIRDVHAIPREQLWAEAVHAWRERPCRDEITLPSELWGVAKKLQEARRVQDPWETRLEEVIRTKWQGREEVTTEEILFDGLQVNLARSTTQDSRRLSRVMSALGWYGVIIQDGGRRVRGYRRKD